MEGVELAGALIVPRHGAGCMNRVQGLLARQELEQEFGQPIQGDAVLASDPRVKPIAPAQETCEMGLALLDFFVSRRAVSTVEEIERVIEQLPSEEFKELAAWMDQRQREREIPPATPGGMAGTSQKYPEPERSPSAACVLRDHSSFLNSYAAENEGLYDGGAAR
jgi:hypothetical protein